MSRQKVSFSSFLIRKIATAIPLIFAVIAINFTLIHLAPADPAILLAGEAADEEYIQELRVEMGLDKPLYMQFYLYAASVLQGELGYSFIHRQPVMRLILARVPATLLLMGIAQIFSVFVGIALGVSSSRRPYSLLDNATTISSLIFFSLPVFWMGQMLLILFGLQLGIVPVGGFMSLRTELKGLAYVIDVLHHAVLPAFVLGMTHLAMMTRLTRASMLEVLGKDFIITARAKGLKEREVIYHHGLRNALLPVVTMVGFQIGRMLAGAVLTETVFGWPGIGRLVYEAIYSRDYPVLMGVFIIVSTSIVVLNLITDIGYSILDPRIEYT